MSFCVEIYGIQVNGFDLGMLELSFEPAGTRGSTTTDDNQLLSEVTCASTICYDQLSLDLRSIFLYPPSGPRRKPFLVTLI